MTVVIFCRNWLGMGSVTNNVGACKIDANQLRDFKAKWKKVPHRMNNERERKEETVKENGHKVNAFGSLNMERQT